MVQLTQQLSKWQTMNSGKKVVDPCESAVNCNLMDNLVIFEATTLLEIIGKERDIWD